MQGLLVTVWPWLLPPASLPGEPGTAGAGWHCHPCVPRHLVSQKGTTSSTQHLHRHQGTAAVTSAPALTSLPHHPVAVPLLGLERCPQCLLQVGGSGLVTGRCLGPALAETGRWDGLLPPAQHLPLVTHSERWGLVGAGISVRGKLRQGHDLGSFPVSLPWLCPVSPHQ